jgi:hypothetical protein
MYEFLIPCHECKNEYGNPKRNPFPTKGLGGGKPANPAHSPGQDWSVLFKCPRCGLVSLYANRDIKKLDGPERLSTPHLYAMSFECCTAKCRSRVTVYASAEGLNPADRAEDLIKQLLKSWHFDASVKCDNRHTPQKPTYDAIRLSPVFPSSTTLL